MTWSVPVYLCTENVFQCFRMNYQKWKYMGLGNIFRAFSTYVHYYWGKMWGELWFYTQLVASPLFYPSLCLPHLFRLFLFFLNFFLTSQYMHGGQIHGENNYPSYLCLLDARFLTQKEPSLIFYVSIQR